MSGEGGRPSLEAFLGNLEGLEALRWGAGAAAGHDLAVRLLEGRRARVRRGEAPGGRVAFGYYRETALAGAPLRPHPQESRIVQAIFREYLRQRSLGRVAGWLNAQGITSRSGKRWSRAAVAHVLRNSVYLGRVAYGEVKARGLHEPIVAPVVFHKAQKAARELRQRRSRQAQGLGGRK